jgi:hypothetical protein
MNNTLFVKRLKNQRFMIRTLKIQSEYRESSNPVNRRYTKGWNVPLLLLKGRWLERAGFAPFSHANIQVMEGKLIIEPVNIDEP